MENEIINLLEKRISALEIQAFNNNSNNQRNQAITDLLLQTQTMITSALSCRENIVSILERMPRLNEYLNPCYTDSEMELEMRRQYVLELYPDLKMTAEIVGKFDKLKVFAGSFSEVADLSDKLNKLTVSTLNIYGESKSVTNQVLQALQQYNDITMSIRVLFAELDKSVSELEAALEPKLKMEE